MDTSQVYSVSRLYGSRIKPTDERFGQWLLLENLCNNNLITDIGNVDYVDGEKLLKDVNVDSLTPITDPFCDNIMLVKICGMEHCVERGKTPIVKKEICGGFNSILRGIFGKFVSARHGVKAKLPFLLESENRMANGVRTIIGEDGLQSLITKYAKPVCVPYKVDLADVKLETLLEELPDLLSQLKTEDFYLMDLDITQDFSGVFNKAEMRTYLINNFNFCAEGERKKNSNVIVENDETVGIDCLTWLTSNARIKIYNKFICQITSPGVNKTIGNHIVDFLNCPDARLKETFRSTVAKKHGITRLEATIYNYSNENYNSGNEPYNPLDDCLTLLENSKLYFQDAPFYSVSVPKMWMKLTETLQNSCCLVFNNILQYVYWGNRNTRKLTGLQIKLKDESKEREKIIRYAISAFGFNCLPINYIEVVEEEGNKDDVQIVQKCFIKTGETYFSRTGTPFSTAPEEINIEEHGLVKTSNVIPQVLRKRRNVNNKLSPYTIKEIDPLAKAYVQSTRKRKMELEEKDLKKRRLDYLEQTASIKEEYMDLLGKEVKLLEFRKTLVSYFSTRWKNLDLSGTYKISAFVVNNKETFSYVGVLAENDGQKHVYFLKGYYKNMFINIDREKLQLDGYVFTPHNGMEIVSLASLEPFIKFNTNGITSFKGHSFPNVEKLELYTNVWKSIGDVAFTQENVEQINSLSMEEINGAIKIRECYRLETMLEGVQLVIKAVKIIDYRKKRRYIAKFENLDASSAGLATSRLHPAAALRLNSLTTSGFEPKTYVAKTNGTEAADYTEKHGKMYVI